ncbi:EAL domain-containing protein [Methylophaga sp.]|uniref:EAL domain-containing protein n=1 Tax=Methylophaga sp. TaxID=2024840 RepID=UPI003F69D7AB
MKILIVEDDPIFIYELKNILSGMCAVFIASSGQSAVATARDILPDLILLDIGLPDFDGFDVMNEINNNDAFKATSIIVITSSDTHKMHKKSLDFGAIDFISKPVDHKLLQTKVRNVLNQAQSISDQAKNECFDEYSSLDRRFKNVLAMLSEAVVICDPNGQIEMVNDYCNKLFGYADDELIGKNINSLLPDRAGADKAHSSAHYVFDDTDMSGVLEEIKTTTRKGKNIHIEINLIDYTDKEGSHYLALIRDISEIKRTQARLLKTALYDSLTGLHSREALDLDTERLVEIGTTKSIFACLVDIDRFHQLNAVFGYERCNALLKNFATHINKALSNLGVRVYRVASDVFIIKSLNPLSADDYDLHQKVVKKALENVIATLSTEMNHRLSMTAIGSVFNSDNLKNGALVPMLEDALKLIKEQGHIGKLQFVDELNYGMRSQLAELSQSLLDGIDRSKLSVVYQPKVSQNGHVSSCEALLRWEDESFRRLQLADYISVAEDTGAIIEVGYFVVEEACIALAELNQAGRQMNVSINLSLRQLADRHLIENIENICYKHAISTKAITFEITESVVAENFEMLTSTLFMLKEQGFSLSVDDFGTGHSNFKYINKLPIDEIKIDKSFLDDVIDAKGFYPIIDTIINMTVALKLKVVAEGVETQTQVDYLNKKGCDYIQGFFFYRPLTKAVWLETFSSTETPFY